MKPPNKASQRRPSNRATEVASSKSSKTGKASSSAKHAKPSTHVTNNTAENMSNSMSANSFAEDNTAKQPSARPSSSKLSSSSKKSNGKRSTTRSQKYDDMQIFCDGTSPDPRHNIEELAYFHGMVAGSQAQKLLKEEGDYLLRAKLLRATINKNTKSSNTASRSKSKGKVKRKCLVVLSYQTKKGDKHLSLKANKTGDWCVNTFEQKLMTNASLDALIKRIVDNHVLIGKEEYKTVLKKSIVKPVYHIKKDQLVISDESLGDGAYGLVKRAKLTLPNAEPSKTPLEVAVKMFKPDFIYMGEELRREADLMVMLRVNQSKTCHENIVNLHGVTCTLLPIYMAIDFYPNGALDKYIKKNEVTGKQRLEWTRQVACGCQHIINSHIVHRDLALRNILLDEACIAKIGDFGLAHRIRKNKKTDHYEVMLDSSKQVQPVPYMAPETLNGTRINYFDEQTDIYSYGILVWELFTNGKEPWAEVVAAAEAGHVRDALVPLHEKGESLPIEESWPECIKKLIEKCLQKKREQRPTFKEVLDKLIDLEKLKIENENQTNSGNCDPNT